MKKLLHPLQKRSIQLWHPSEQSICGESSVTRWSPLILPGRYRSWLIGVLKREMTMQQSRANKWKNKVIPYFFVLPGMVLNILFFLYPFLQSLMMSFFNWPVLGEKAFIGIKNYITLFSDEQFWKSIGFTMKYAVLVTPCLFLLAFALALLVNGRFRGVVFFRSVYFAPVVISMSCCSLVWLWIYNDLYGVLNYLLDLFGIINEPVLWMNSAKTSLPAVIFMVTWKMAGFSMLIILSALQSVEEEIYEASSIDGANKVRQFFTMTLPIIRPHVALAMIISVIGSVLAFEQFLVLTKGGPSRTTTTIVHYIYDTSFKYQKLGYGSTITMILVILLVLLSFFQSKILTDPSEN